MNVGQTVFHREGPVGFITFERPGSRNAMTWEMYEQLREICDNAANDGELRLLVLRGAGGNPLIARINFARVRSMPHRTSTTASCETIPAAHRIEPTMHWPPEAGLPILNRTIHPHRSSGRHRAARCAFV
jgi:enoyl-CoA hydratase/carnithine racemase